MRLFIFISPLLFCVISCSKEIGSTADGNIQNNSDALTTVNYPKQLEPKAYIDWHKAEKNLMNKRVMGELSYEIKYLPPEYMTLKSLGPDATNTEIKQELTSYSDLLYFNLRIELEKEQTELLKYKVSGLSQYDQRVKYYSFNVQKDIWMVLDNKDSVVCSITHFERAFNVTNFSDIMIGFDKKSVTKLNSDWKKMVLVFNDKVFGNGIVKFEFDRNQITNTPSLELN